MSIIVYSPEEMVIVADRFVMNTKQIRVGFGEVSFDHHTKVHISEDNHFAYCFEITQENKFIPVILNFIKRFESGQLEKEEKLEITSDVPFCVGIMSRRHFYMCDSRVKDNKLTIQHTMWSNHYTETVLYRALQLPAVKVWQVIGELTGVAHSLDYDVVKASQLTLIKKTPKKTKPKKDEVTQ